MTKKSYKRLSEKIAEKKQELVTDSKPPESKSGDLYQRLGEMRVENHELKEEADRMMWQVRRANRKLIEAGQFLADLKRMGVWSRVFGWGKVLKQIEYLYNDKAAG